MTATDWVVVTEYGQSDRVVPILGQLFVGRKLGGVAGEQQVLLDDPAISRAHLELRIDDPGSVVLIDQSTNGTRVNGQRAEPGEPLALRDGDLIEAGTARLGFRSLQHPERMPAAFRSKLPVTQPTLVVSVVGDVAGVDAASDELVTTLRELLTSHGGAIGKVDGASLYAAWDATDDPEAIERAVRAAVAANELVSGQAAGDAPVSMGWAVTLGDATEAHTSTTCQAVHRYAINLAFRLSAVAAGKDESAVLVTAEVAEAAPAAALYGDLRELAVSGRDVPARVHAAAPTSE
jgi:pSer/pThr/pTyr-binding forkhead associated (FHA) protein